MRISRKKRLEVLATIRETPGINWIRPIAKLPKDQRKALLEPILRKETDPQTKKAINIFLKYSETDLEKIASGGNNYRRLFAWEWFKNYMKKNGYNDHSKPSRSLRRAPEAIAA